MPVFTAAAAFIASAIGVTSVLGVAAINLGVRILATAVVSSLISNRAQPQQNPAGTQSASQTTGSRVMLPASTDNKIGVVYGSAFISPAMIDAKISTDQKTMWYAMALCEVTDTGVITMGDVNSTNSDIYWGDKQLVFDATDKTKVIKWVNSNGEEDTKVNGFMNVYLYKNGSYIGVNTTTSAIDIMSDDQIDPTERWNGSRYSSGSSSPTMAGVCFVIVKLVYNQDAGITGLDQFKIKVTNTLTKPGSVIYDYLTNKRYGCGIPFSQVDEASIAALDSYSDELISYTNTDGGTSQQPRYRVNGPVNTGINCLNNLQYLVDTCDSWLQWNEAVAKWSIIPNRSYLDYTTYADLFVIDANNITTGVNVSPVDLNSTYNLIESQFPNAKIKDQTDYNFIYLDAADKNPNEPINKLVIQYPQVNNSVQAHYLATRRLIQSREDLVVNFSTDYSGIQIDAGDVVRVRHPVYGWGPYPGNLTNPDKLFRVEQVQESKSEDGNLGVHLSLIEYNNQVYENIDITDYQPAANTGLSDPTIVGTPSPPTISNIVATANTFNVNCVIPTVGAIIAMEFWYGPTPTIEDNNYKLWDTQFNATTPVYIGGSTETSNVVGFQPSTYYWAVRAVTQSTKSKFSNSTAQSWSPSQPANRKTCDQITSQTVNYTDLYKLWAPNTRGSVLTCDYTPGDNGSDVGGKSTNQIQLDIAINGYISGTSTGLVSEVWTASNGIPADGFILSMAYGNNGYIMGSVGLIWFTGNMQGQTTAHPDTYLTYAVDVPGYTVNGVASNGSRYVAVGSNGLAIFSDNGYNNWYTAIYPSSAAGVQFNDVIWNGSIFVAVGGVVGGSKTYIMTSTDGYDWNVRHNSVAQAFNSVAWNGSSFLALGDTFIRGTSTDGITWNVSYVTGGSSIVISGVAWNIQSSRWMAVGGSNDGTSKIFTSSDTATFNTQYTGPSGTFLMSIGTNQGDVYNDTFAVGSQGLIVSSGDGGITWSKQQQTTYATYFTSRVLNGSFYLAGPATQKPLVWPISTSSVNFDLIDLWQTGRVWVYGASQTDPYSTTIQAVQDQMPNNIPVTASIKTGLYFKDVKLRYLLVAGDLNNPTTPSTMYASRKSISITEFKG